MIPNPYNQSTIKSGPNSFANDHSLRNEDGNTGNRWRSSPTPSANTTPASTTVQSRLRRRLSGKGKATQGPNESHFNMVLIGWGVALFFVFAFIASLARAMGIG